MLMTVGPTLPSFALRIAREDFGLSKLGSYGITEVAAIG